MAVIDTNVLVSSLFSKEGKYYPAMIIEYVFRGVITPLYNDEILNEYQEVLSRNKFKFPKSLIDEFLNGFINAGINTERTATYLEELPDKDDLVFYEIKMSVEDSYLVTGNLKHFPMDPKVVNPRQMVELLIDSGFIH